MKSVPVQPLVVVPSNTVPRCSKILYVVVYEKKFSFSFLWPLPFQTFHCRILARMLINRTKRGFTLLIELHSLSQIMLAALLLAVAAAAPQNEVGIVRQENEHDTEAQTYSFR